MAVNKSFVFPCNALASFCADINSAAVALVSFWVALVFSCADILLMSTLASCFTSSSLVVVGAVAAPGVPTGTLPAAAAAAAVDGTASFGCAKSTEAVSACRFLARLLASSASSFFFLAAARSTRFLSASFSKNLALFSCSSCFFLSCSSASSSSTLFLHRAILPPRLRSSHFFNPPLTLPSPFVAFHSKGIFRSCSLSL
mmetsp:Transcript_9430/g.20221  ORF Transcript_9430/g.20221 Transcript_9430/m.20221 type:complete len:200 (-) Transcript_9430:307-906(-)